MKADARSTATRRDLEWPSDRTAYDNSRKMLINEGLLASFAYASCNYETRKKEIEFTDH